MSRTIAGSLVAPDGTALAGTLSLTAKTSTPGAAGVPEGASFDIALVAGAYSDNIELGTYLVDLTETGGNLLRLGEASIDAGAASDILTLIDASASPRSSTLGIAYGGTGATTEAAARISLGLEIGADVQAYDATLLSLAALGTAADKLAYTTGVDTWAEAAITAYGRTLLDDTDAVTARGTLELSASDNVTFAAITGSGDMAIDTDTLFVDVSGNNVGIGTSSPQELLHISGGASAANLEIESGGAQNALLKLTNTLGSYGIYAAPSSDALAIYDFTDAVTRITLDGDGNVGIGVVPETDWQSTYDAIQLGGVGSLYAFAAVSAGGNIHLSHNTWRKGAGGVDTYLVTDQATKYLQSSGTHTFSVAASGTAGTSISWTTALTIDVLGNVGIGVVPEANWEESYTALQPCGTGAIWGIRGQSVGGNLILSENIYYVSGSSRKAIMTDSSGASEIFLAHGDITFTVSNGAVTQDVDFTPYAALKIENNGNIGIGLSPTANMVGLSIEAGVMTVKETTTPTADADYGKIYCKSDNKLYFQDGAGTEHTISATP